jgi:hypothetical protein
MIRIEEWGNGNGWHQFMIFWEGEEELAKILGSDVEVQGWIQEP